MTDAEEGTRRLVGEAEPRIRRAAITSLGCKVNQAEMDAVARLLRARGVELVKVGVDADLHLVNTCTVTAVADDKSRKAVRRARRANPAATVIGTGCAVAVNRASFARLDPAATLVVNDEKDRLLAEVEGLLGGSAGSPSARAGLSPDGCSARTASSGVAGEPARGVSVGRRGGSDGRPAHRRLGTSAPTLADIDAEGGGENRKRTDRDRTRAYVKVQDGCSCFCTYCIIPRARGPERSLPPEAVLADVRRALAAGHREIVLTGINIGTYDGGWSERRSRGAPARVALSLAGLVRRILAETLVERIRLSSIEPQHVDDDLLDAWTINGAGRCLPHVHLPLQSGDDGVLRRMGRRCGADAYARVVARVRARVPGVAIHADVIAGFPTEDEAAFERSLTFIRALDLAGLHVFRYSPRPGTAATRMSGQVPDGARKERAATLLAEAAACRTRFAARTVGGRRNVLFEVPAGGDDGAGWLGHAEDHVLVRAVSRDGRSLENEIAIVAIDGTDPLTPGRAIGRIERLARTPAGAVPRAPARRPASYSWDRGPGA